MFSSGADSNDTLIKVNCLARYVNELHSADVITCVTICSFKLHEITMSIHSEHSN